MTRGPLSFKEADLKRAVKSARAAGLQISSVEVTKAGNIIVHVCKRTEVETTDNDQGQQNTWADIA